MLSIVSSPLTENILQQQTLIQAQSGQLNTNNSFIETAPANDHIFTMNGMDITINHFTVFRQSFILMLKIRD